MGCRHTSPPCGDGAIQRRPLLVTPPLIRGADDHSNTLQEKKAAPEEKDVRDDSLIPANALVTLKVSINYT